MALAAASLDSISKKAMLTHGDSLLLMRARAAAR
jgi:hypothetical protein